MMNVWTTAVRTELSASTIWTATAASVHRDTGTGNHGNTGSSRNIVDTLPGDVNTVWVSGPENIILSNIKLHKYQNTINCNCCNFIHTFTCSWTFPLSGEFCEVGLPPPSPCQLAQCQNSAPCVEKTGTAVCQCLPGFEGQSCEKLVSVNFVDRDSYVQLQDIKNWPQANITLQVR